MYSIQCGSHWFHNQAYSYGQIFFAKVGLLKKTENEKERNIHFLFVTSNWYAASK